jgi:glutamate/tyrosine decarboxylase-like PLP-dependent enzyme
MNERMDRLRRLSQPLEPSFDQHENWTKKIATRAQLYLESLTRDPAFSSSTREGKGILESPFSETPQELDAILNLLEEQVMATGIKLGAPGFLGFIPISSLYPAALGDYLGAVINPFVGNFFASPGAVRLEHFLTRWMAEFVGYPETSAGDLTSGGSIANLSAIVAAREARSLKSKDHEKAVVYLSAQTHHSVTKALRIAGLGECVQRLISLDGQHRMQAENLEKRISDDKKLGLLPWLVVGSAGSTDTGAVDPLTEISRVAREHQLWLHVDGAYGAMFALCEPGRRILAGMEQSDSLTLDPHKGLFMPCGSGAILVRNGKHLRDAYRYDASYMQDRPTLASLDEVSPSELSPELTRPFRGLRLWLSLKLLGLGPFRAALEEKMLLARHFYEQIQAVDQVEVGPAPDLSVVVFRWIPPVGDPNDFNQRLLRAVLADGRVFISSTRLNRQFWLRLAVLCATTHREHIDLAIELLKDASKRIYKAGANS